MPYWYKGNHEEQLRFLIFYLSKTNAFPLVCAKNIHQKSWERSLQFSSEFWHSGGKDGERLWRDIQHKETNGFNFKLLGSSKQSLERVESSEDVL